MKIVSSFLPEVNTQNQLKSGNSSAQPSAFELNNEPPESVSGTPNLIVGEVETVLEQVQSRRELVDLRALQTDHVPLNNLRALASYQTIAAEPAEPTSSIPRLDIIV